MNHSLWTTKFMCAWASASLLLGLSGCGPSLGSSLSGTVKIDGNPIPFAQLHFENAGDGPSAYSMCDEQGRYLMQTGGERSLAPGKYRIAVQPPRDVQIPIHYGSVRTSQLEVDVAPGSNVFDIELKNGD